MKKESETKLVKQLALNNVTLQKISTNLLEENIKLIKRIDKLVSIFEEASKHVGEIEVTDEKIKGLAAKLESLLEQNKDIAKGLILLEKYVRGKSGFEELNPKPLTGYRY